jgi:hypothetical protein
MPDLETLIAETVERAVQKALGEALSKLPSSAATPSDDEVMNVPELATFLGIGQRQTYQLVNCDPAQFVVKRVGTRILVTRGAIRRWLEDGGEVSVAPMRAETRRLLESRKTQARGGRRTP